MAHYDLRTPLTEEQVRALRVNDTVTLEGALFGVRDANLIALFDRGRTTRFDFHGHAALHTAPNVKKVPPSKEHPTGYAPICVGTTTSARMERFTRPLMERGVRLVIGKGGLGAPSAAAFAQLGGAYLAVIGGTAALETTWVEARRGGACRTTAAARNEEASLVDYAERERNPVRHLPSITMVVILHIALGYALVTGLARKVVEVMKQPLETKIIEEIKKPPPDTPPPPPPKLVQPPPPFIPPPEINIQVPIAQMAPTITTVTTTPPPVAAPKIEAPPAPQPVVRKEYKATSCPKPSFPRQAITQGISGSVTAWVHVA